MPTTISRVPVRGIAVALAVWFLGMAAAAYLFDPSVVVVFAPAGEAIGSIARADGRVLTSGTGFATGSSDRAGFVRRLYAEGAWFVWPSLTHGCFAAGRFTR